MYYIIKKMNKKIEVHDILIGKGGGECFKIIELI